MKSISERLFDISITHEYSMRCILWSLIIYIDESLPWFYAKFLEYIFAIKNSKKNNKEIDKIYKYDM